VRAVVERALKDGRQVRMTYVGATRDAVSERTVSPHSLVTYAGHEYVSAYCHEAEAPRTFRLDRISAAEVLPSLALDLPAEPIDSVTPTVGEDVVVRVAPRARWFLETLAPSAQALRGGTDDDAGHSVVTLRVADLTWLVRTVVGFGGLLEVLGPPSARQAVVAEAEEALKVLGAGDEATHEA